MSLWDKVRGELIDIVQWIDDTNDTLVYRFERYNNQIKYGAQMTVREGQAAVFVNEGRIADVFQPGMYSLETKNLPVLSTLQGWKYGFNSPFLAEVYFCSMRQFTDLKWGTMNPIMMRDAEFGPVRLRAFGTYVVRVKDPATVIRQIVGTDGRFTVEEIVNQLRNLIVSRFAEIAGQSKIPVLDMAANYGELGDFLTKRIAPEFETYGLELTKLLVENISLPPAVEEALDKRTSMGVVGNLAAYTQFNVANSIPDAAKNPGGLAAAGAGIGMGMAMAAPIGQALSGQQPGGASSTAVPPPIPEAPTYFVAVAGQRTGPFDVQALASQAATGRLTQQTLVWTQGMAQWTPASQVPALAGIFANVPPPLPPNA
ncbi:MAG TPA: SPFH domain-containing protein [Acidobacteriota bacterium]|nr:SPFH domain-containing protein [Acidobacteriota bacterium]